MDINTAMEKFKSARREARAYGHALDVLSYDGMTCAPRNSSGGRAATSAALSEMLQRLVTDEGYFEALTRLEAEGPGLGPVMQAEVSIALAEAREQRRIPAEVHAGHTRVTGEAFAVWQRAKAASDSGMLAPYLERVFSSARDIALCAAPELDPYDYWLGRNERGADTALLEGFFGLVERELAPLTARTAELEKPDNAFLHGRFPIEKQRAFSNKLMSLMGLDRARCTIGEAEHPYTTVISRDDVRITTHYHEDHFDANMFTVLHEGGHALYALNLGQELAGTKLEFAASAGMNEAISRFYENIIGRSPGFAELILPELKVFFPQELEGVTEAAFFRAVNRVEPSLKRTEADELTYPIHILIRYRLEKALMDGSLAVRELPGAWNSLYKEHLGIEPPDDAAGCLQDMHWASGLIGYFPTYALGNAYGAQLYAAMHRELDPDEAVRRGDITAVTAWLRDRVMKYGRMKTPQELLYDCCGQGFDPKFYVEYLKQKYGRLYGI